MRYGLVVHGGAGAWDADVREAPFAAASATGHGELMLRCLATKRVRDWVESGLAAQAAVDRVLAEMAATGDLTAAIRR